MPRGPSARTEGRPVREGGARTRKRAIEIDLSQVPRPRSDLAVPAFHSTIDPHSSDPARERGLPLVDILGVGRSMR